MKEKVLEIKKQIETLKQMFEVFNYCFLEDIDDFYLEMFNHYLSTIIQDLYQFDNFVDFKIKEKEFEEL